MKKLLITFLFINLFIVSAHAYELVLPQEKSSVVTTQYALFVGKTGNNESVTINDNHIHTAKNGAFAYSIKLKNGNNRILIRSNYKTQIYQICKKEPIINERKAFIQLKTELYKVKNDNTPLRNTPEDFGLNRVAHLFKDTNLLIDGEQGDFYRVSLSKNQSAWIKKDDVYKYESNTNVPEFVSMNSENFKNASIHKIEFTENLPYTIEENGKEIVFKVYNPQVSDKSVYTLNIKHAKKYYYKIVLSKGLYQIKVNELLQSETNTLDGITIAVDAGHGGSEKGAVGCLGDNEKDVNLAIATELKNILTQMGANVVMTRECDANMSLEDRIVIAKENSANIFVSIHLNSIPDICMDINDNRGTSVFYYNKNSKDLAEYIEKSMTNELSTKNDGVKSASFAVIRPTDYIGVLVEAAYMTNPLDSVLYTSIDFPKQAAQAIANGISKYVNSD